MANIDSFSSSKQYMVKMEAWSSLMLTEMNKLRLEQKYCDVLLSVENKVLYAHRIVLSIGSRLFRNLLANANYSQYKELHIALPQDLDSHAVEALLAFMYTGSISLNASILPKMYKVAHYFIMDHVVQICNAYSKMNSEFNTSKIQSSRQQGRIISKTPPKIIKTPKSPRQNNRTTIKPTYIPKKKVHSKPLLKRYTSKFKNSILFLKQKYMIKECVVRIKTLTSEEIRTWTCTSNHSKLLKSQVSTPAVVIKQEPIDTDISDSNEIFLHGHENTIPSKNFIHPVSIKKEPPFTKDTEGSSYDSHHRKQAFSFRVGTTKLQSV